MVTIHLPEGGSFDSMMITEQGRTIKICVSHPNMPDIPEGEQIPNCDYEPWKHFERTAEQRDKEFHRRMDMQDGFGGWGGNRHF
jgi:hypothetical protein